MSSFKIKFQDRKNYVKIIRLSLSELTMQQISLGKLLYAYFHLDVSFSPDLFLDKRVRDFVTELNKIDVSSVGKLDSWNGIIAQPCTELGIKNEVFSSRFRSAINDKHVELISALENGNWKLLANEFEGLMGTSRIGTKLRRASNMEIKIPKFLPLFPEWDEAFFGILPEDFIILYAMTGVGKSLVSSYIAGQLLKTGKTVAFYPTELTVEKATCAIFGYTLAPTPLRPDEAIHYFDAYPEKLKECQEKYGHNLIIPESNIFDWLEWEEMYKMKPEFVILDQMSTAMSAVGMDEVDHKQAAKFSKQLLAMKLKYMIPSLIVMQEGYRPPSPQERKQFGGLADKMDFGTGNVRGTNGPKGDASLALNLILDPITRQRTLLVKKDRDRNLISGENIFEVFLDNKGRWEVGKLRERNLTEMYNEINLTNIGETLNEDTEKSTPNLAGDSDLDYLEGF